MTKEEREERARLCSEISKSACAHIVDKLSASSEEDSFTENEVFAVMAAMVIRFKGFFNEYRAK